MLRTVSTEVLIEECERRGLKVAEEMRERERSLPDVPTARPADEPDGFVLFDSKRDYLNQIDAYREWQRR